jgi:chorismate mutase
MSTCKVLIDPGHGGTDHGATMASGLVEKDITLQTAQNIATLMSKDGFEVLLSRKADIDLPLLSRLNAINSASPDLVISVHLSIRPPVVKQTADSNRVTINILALRECEDTDKTDEECGVFSPAKDEIKNGIKIARLLEEELNKTGVTKATVHLLQHIIPNNRVLAPSVLVDIEFSSTALPDDVTAITPVIGAALQRGVFTYFSQMAQNQRSLSSITPNLPGNLIENSLTQDPDQTTQATELSGNSIPKEPADSESSMINTPSQLSEGIRGNTLNEPVFNNSRPLINTTPEGIDLEEFLGPDPDSYIERNQ